MKSILSILVVLTGLAGVIAASPLLHEEVFGRSLGGWNVKGGKAVDYEISGAKYRTWRPHVTPTLDGGIFVSVRIDHLRGLMASDDHASLELGFNPEGDIISAQSTIALQGRKITSDVVEESTWFGTSASGVDRVVKVGTDLVASLTAKLLREKITEPGRVGFPAAVRHNYNLLCLAVHRDVQKAVPVGATDPGLVEQGEPSGTSTKPADKPAEPGQGGAANPSPSPEAPAESEANTAKKEPAPAPELKIVQQGKPPKKNASTKTLPK